MARQFPPLAIKSQDRYLNFLADRDNREVHITLSRDSTDWESLMEWHHLRNVRGDIVNRLEEQKKGFGGGFRQTGCPPGNSFFKA
jgi:hypothetical protein